MATRAQDAERERLAQAAQRKADWRRFGPYLTERQWGTIREDYSANGDAWSSFPHEHARSRAYRWGEDGLLGVANPEGNHGEDVKECYYYLDATPTASYLKALYKYPQAAFPYAQLVSVNRARSKAEPEYELLDTGIFDGNRYFDVFVEYAKAAPDDILVRITAHNRGPARAPLHLLPTLWFRNTWSWKGGIEEDIPKPAIRLAGRDGVVAEHARLGRLNLVAAAALGTVDGPRWMFTENETNVQRLYGQPNPSPYVKDGFHAAVVEHRADAVHPEGGTKSAAHFRADAPRDQLQLMLREWYMAPSGHLAAYEYDFGDVNPPVHAWACRKLLTFGTGRAEADVDFLRRVFPKLLMNFAWWVNRKDPAGENLFTGGFLGMDNIGIFDRNAKLPGGVQLEQSDATAWMAFFCNEMLAITIELARVDPHYAEMASTFVQHFASISEALNGPGGLWDEEAGFYHDQLRSGDRRLQLKVRSLVGLMPLVGAVSIQGGGGLEGVRRRLLELTDRYPCFRNQVQGPVERPGPDGRPMPTWLLSLVPRDRLERLFRTMFDEREFLSPHGIRSMSRIHLEHPVVMDLEGQRFEVRYLPGESDSWMFGGNSNWRGPVWMPLNALFVEALYDYHRFYGDDLQVELPTGSGRRMNLRQAAVELATRLLGLFRADATGRRPCHGGERRYAEDPNWKDLILFNEYFHGDTGRGCGASHQTGWTGLAAVLAHLLAVERGGRAR